MCSSTPSFLKKSRITPKDGSGFTLIEVVVASTLLTLLMTGLYQVTAVGFSLWDKGQKKIDAQQNIRTAVFQISRELRTAQTWDIGMDGPSTLPNNSIVMEIPEAGDPNVCRRIRYYLRGENLLRDVNEAGHNVVAYGIKKVEFSGDVNSNIITVSVEAKSGFCITTKACVRAARDGD